MKNLIIVCLLLLSTGLSAQNISLSAQYLGGGNYAIQNEEALTGVTHLAQLTITNETEADFGFELGVAAGYSSLAKTFKTTVAQVSLGFTDNSFVSGGFIVQYMDKNDLLSAGGYVQLNYPLTKDEMKNPKLSVALRGNLIVNILDFQEIPTIANGSAGIKYTF